MILTRSTRIGQPQGPVEISPEFGDAVAFVPGAVNPTFATRTTRVLTTKGRAERGSAATGGVSPSTAAYIAFPESARTFFGNKPHWAFVSGNIANTAANSWLFGAGQPSANAGILLTYLASTGRLEFATRVAGTWYASSAAVTLSANREFEAGYSIDADGTFRLYWNRVEVLVKPGVGATTPTPNLPPTAGIAYASQTNNNLYGNSASIAFAAVGQSEYADRIGARLAANPWQLFRPVQRRVYFDMGAGGGDVVLAGSSASQVNTSSSGAITQTHVLSGASVDQSNTSTSGAIGQSIILTGASVAQGNASTSGAVSQTHVLIGANCQQANTSTSGAVVQTGDLIGANCAQVNTSSSGSISQTHVLSGASCIQPNTTTSGAVIIVSVVILTGANCAQGNTTTTGATSQSHVLIGAPVAIDHIATASSIVQTHILSGADCSQSNYSTTGSINQVVIPSQFVASVPAGEYSATVPAGIFKASI